MMLWRSNVSPTAVVQFHCGLPASVFAFAVVAILALPLTGCTAEKSGPPAKRRTAFEISALGSSFDEAIVSDLRKLTDVDVVAPMVTRHTRVTIGGKKHDIIAMGIAPEHDRDVRSFKVIDGKLSDKQDGVLLEGAFAQTAGVKLGEEVKFISRIGMVNSTVVGLYELKTTRRAVNESIMLMPLQAAQTFFDAKGKVDSALVILKSGADQERARSAIEKILPKDVGILDSPQPGDNEKAQPTGPAQGAAIKK